MHTGGGLATAYIEHDVFYPMKRHSNGQGLLRSSSKNDAVFKKERLMGRHTQEFCVCIMIVWKGEVVA